jgi:general secretion pathway protein G
MRLGGSLALPRQITPFFPAARWRRLTKEQKTMNRYSSLRRASVAAGRSGFTLIEVLLVLVILVVLAAIAVPMYQGIGERAKLNAAQTQVGLFKSAIDNYQMTVSQLPTTLDDLVTRPGDAKASKRWAGPYIEVNKELIDPWDNPYQYTAKGTKNQGGFDVWSLGPDGQNGTDDDIGNWPEK